MYWVKYPRKRPPGWHLSWRHLKDRKRRWEKNNCNCNKCSSVPKVSVRFRSKELHLIWCLGGNSSSLGTTLVHSRRWRRLATRDNGFLKMHRFMFLFFGDFWCLGFQRIESHIYSFTFEQKKLEGPQFTKVEKMNKAQLRH